MITLKVFTDQHTALKAIALLKEHGIESGLAQKYENSVQTFRLEVAENNEQQAKSLLSDSEDTIELAHNYLESFTEEELLEVLVNREGYHPSVVANAQVLLKRKRPTLDIASVEAHHQSRYREELLTVKEGKTLTPATLAMAYLTVLIGGVGGIVTGMMLEEGRTNGPDGKSYHTYAPAVRKHGKIMRWIGILSLAIIIIYRILSEAL